MEVVKFVAFIVRIGILLALIGQLKFCTLMMMGLASEKSQKGIMSYSKYTRQLTGNGCKQTRIRRVHQEKTRTN